MSLQDFPANWNPWHGCTKISPGCRHCYVYRQDEMYGSEIGSEIARKTLAFDWVLSLREQCIQSGISFRFHQTGAKLIKDGKLYYIRRCYQHEQAKKAGVDWGE